MPTRPHHDMGGLPASKVEKAEHDYAAWEKRVDAMMVLLSDKKRRLMNTDMLRRGIESLPAGAYDRMSYYERWMHSIATMMQERGVVTKAELDQRMAKLRAAEEK
ncbi:MAG: nitrile hydratase subunit beta [Alphaproteobacteria bacterium]|nr:nitrile hydratase subunit beta [Alphaproteobacteria bacterium]